jgi:LmbE family N-acetylglucosaminyl deacetylase
VRDGQDVRVSTLFSAAGAEAAKLYRARRAEDREAVRELGASPEHVGVLDAPFRSTKYRDFPGIVFGRAREYPATQRVVAEVIRKLLLRWSPLQVICPMAVGNHVDHRLVRDAALLSVAPDKLLFYEDRPYAFAREQVEHVLGLSVARQPEQFWSRYFAATYVRNYRGTTTDARIVRGWSKALPFPKGFRLSKAFTVEPSAAELARSLAAIRAYRTQMPDLFANDAELEALYGSVPETLWWASGAACPTKIQASATSVDKLRYRRVPNRNAGMICPRK